MLSPKTYHRRQVTEQYLFKFLSTSHLLSFLETGNIWLSRGDGFGDKMECVRIAHLRNLPKNLNRLRKRQQEYLISCWHLADQEMLSFWDTYCTMEEDRKIFALRFKTQYLFKKFDAATIQNDRYEFATLRRGHVRYRNLVSLTNLEKNVIKYPAFRKEYSYSYENEYRFVIHCRTPYSEDGFNYCLNDPKYLSFDILINPYLQANALAKAKMTIKSSGFIKRLKNSPFTKWINPSLNIG